MRYHLLLPVLAFACASLVCAADPVPPKAEEGKGAAPAAAAPPQATAMPAELLACDYGRSRFPEKFAFKDGQAGENVDLAWGFYVVRAGREVTLIDTGFSDEATAKQWHVVVSRRPEELLADLKIAPESVTRIIITHIHFDHLANLPLFPKAQVVMSRRDRDNYVNQKRLGGVVHDARIAAILADETRTHVVDERELLPGALALEFEVVGGHTAGSAVVHLRHGGTHYVLTGDECYLCANAEQQRPIGQTVDAARNAAFLKRLAAEPALVVLPAHDPVIFKRYPQVVPGVVRVFGEE